MKPCELEPLNRTEHDFTGYAETYRLYSQYRFKDCVIAYRKSFMGTAFLIYGKRDMFGFLIMNRLVNKWISNSPELQRKKIREIKLLFNEEGEDKVIIVDENAYKLFERKVLFSSIE